MDRYNNQDKKDSVDSWKTVAKVSGFTSAAGMGIGYLASCVADDESLTSEQREGARKLSEASYNVSSKAGEIAMGAVMAFAANKEFSLEDFTKNLF